MTDTRLDDRTDIAAEAVNACIDTLLGAGLPREEVLAGALAAAVSAIAAECSGREAASLCLTAARHVADLPAADHASLIGMRPQGRA